MDIWISRLLWEVLSLGFALPQFNVATDHKVSVDFWTILSETALQRTEQSEGQNPPELLSG
jgi:hypothetical protein